MFRATWHGGDLRSYGFVVAGTAALVALAAGGCGNEPAAPGNADSVVATIPVPGGAYGIAVAPTGTVYATQPGGSTLVHISLSTLSVVRSVPVGAAPTGVAFSSDGATAYVTNQFSRNLGIVSVAADSQVDAVAVHGDPFVTLPSPDGSRVYVAANDDSLFVVDPAARTVTASLHTGSAPNGLAFNPAATRLYVSNFVGRNVVEVDPAIPLVLRTFTTGGTPQGLAVSADGSELYVANEDGWLDVFDLSTGARADSVPLAGPAFGLALSPDGAVLYVGLIRNGAVAVVRRATHRVIKTLVTGGDPRRIAFTADGRHAVIANLAGWVDVVTR